MLVFYQKFKECGIMFLKNSENTSGAFASWYWAMDKDKDVPTLPILASFWRTFRSACPPFPNLPAFGGHSGLHAHPSQQLVFSLVRMWAGCLLIVQNVSSLSSHWPECWQLVSSLVRMRAACLLIGLNGIVCRYHLGTLAFGSLIIAIIRMIRVMLEGRMYKFKLLLASIS